MPGLFFSQPRRWLVSKCELQHGIPDITLAQNTDIMTTQRRTHPLAVPKLALLHISPTIWIILTIIMEK